METYSILNHFCITMHQIKLHSNKFFFSYQVQIENPQCLGSVGTSDKAERLHGAPFYYGSLKRRTNLQPMTLNIAQNSIKTVVKNVSDGKLNCYAFIKTLLDGRPSLGFMFMAVSNENVDGLLELCKIHVITSCLFQETNELDSCSKPILIPTGIPAKIDRSSISKECSYELAVRCAHRCLNIMHLCLS